MSKNVACCSSDCKMRDNCARANFQVNKQYTLPAENFNQSCIANFDLKNNLSTLHFDCGEKGNYKLYIAKC